MLVSDFDYDLPEELIAQQPPTERGGSRMLVVSRETSRFHDDVFVNLSRYLKPGDCLVTNNTKVFPARLHARRNHVDGAQVEIFLAKEEGANRWLVLAKPAKRARVGDRLLFDQALSGEIVAEGAFGERLISFTAAQPLYEIFDRIGAVPLPPYIHREPKQDDSERYQTIFAAQRGSVAAPTAGLHFTDDVLEACRQVGAELASVTLHVGQGTFAPLRETSLEKIKLHREWFRIPEESAAAIARARRVVCVGTTSVRSVETAASRGVREGETDLFIAPGFQFQVTGAMLTNFHLPQSSLLILVSALAGRELMLAAYRHAVEQRYRFFSYGDCMLIL